MTVVRVNCPWLLRYIAAAVILQRQCGSKDSRQNPWRQGRRLSDFVRVTPACDLKRTSPTRARRTCYNRCCTTTARSTRTRSPSFWSICTCRQSEHESVLWPTELFALVCRYFDHDLIGAKNTLAELESVLKSDFFLFQVCVDSQKQSFCELPFDFIFIEFVFVIFEKFLRLICLAHPLS